MSGNLMNYISFGINLAVLFFFIWFLLLFRKHLEPTRCTHEYTVDFLHKLTTHNITSIIKLRKQIEGLQEKNEISTKIKN